MKLSLPRAAGLLAAVAALAGICAPPALAQDAAVPTYSAVSGERFSAAGTSAQIIDGTCSNLRDVSINWRDGSPRTPLSGSLAGATIPNPGGEPFPAFRVAVPATEHVFPDVPQPVIVEVTVSYRVTCIAPGGDPNDPFDGEPYEFNGVDQALFNVTIIPGGGSGTPPGGSCPIPGSVASMPTAALGGSTAALIRMSHQYPPCSPAPAFFSSYEKTLFRFLAKRAHDGYLVDKAIDGWISKPEDFIAENFVGKGIIREFVIGKFWGKLVVDKVIEKLPAHKFIPYGWILDAPKYASYLDYAKYAVLTKLANDPPDPNFTALASPPKLRSLRGAKQAGKRDRREAALYIALLTTVERAGGAQQAGAVAVESAQLRHASGIATQLVSLLGAKQKALKAAARTVKRISGRGHRLPRGVVRRAKRQLGSRSSTMFERKALKELGFTDDEIAAAGQDLPATPVKRFTRPFAKVLGLGAQAKTIGRERAMLANFANRHAVGE